GLAAVDAALPEPDAPRARRGGVFVLELGLSFAVVPLPGGLVRPAVGDLLPASPALLLVGERARLAGRPGPRLGLRVDRGVQAWPDRLGEFVNYFSFFAPLHLVAVVLTLATTRQAAHRQRLQALYDELSAAHAELQALHARARETAVTEERNRIAREIHDTVA